MKFKPISNIDTALRIYYQYPEISNKEIKELFGSIGTTTITAYKNAAKKVQWEQGIKTLQLHTVNTEIAFSVWGIDVADLEERRTKLKSLGLLATTHKPPELAAE